MGGWDGGGGGGGGGRAEALLLCKLDLEVVRERAAAARETVGALEARCGELARQVGGPRGDVLLVVVYCMT